MKVNTLISTAAIALAVFTSSCSSSEPDYHQQRQELIDRHSQSDPTFAVLQEAMVSEDTYSADYWRWKIDQYLYGRYKEFQPIYDAFAADRPFSDRYDLPENIFGAPEREPLPEPALPPGYFTENLPGNVHTGSVMVADGRIYIAYQGELTDPFVASYDLATGAWEGPFKAGHSTLSKNGRPVDSHGRPELFQDSRGHFHIVFGGHGGEREDGLNPFSIDTPHAGGRLTHIVSDRPHDISSFVVVDDISPFASYTQVQTMDNGDVYMFTRAGTHKSPWIFYKMKNGTRRFEPPQLITWPVPQRGDPMQVDTFYIATKRIGPTKIAISYLWHPCNFREIHNRTNYSRINTYYLTLDTRTDTFHNAAGEVLPMPLDKAASDRYTLAHDSESQGEYCFSTRPLNMINGRSAVAYQALGEDFREWRMSVFKNDRWESRGALPSEIPENLTGANGNALGGVKSFAVIGRESDGASAAAVIYTADGGETAFGIARAASASDQTDLAWRVEQAVLRQRGAHIEMKTVGEEDGLSAVVLNVRQSGSQRLYLWYDGELRPGG